MSDKEYNKIKNNVEKKELEAALMLSNGEAVASIVSETSIPSKRLYKWKEYLSFYKDGKYDDEALLCFFKGKEQESITNKGRTNNLAATEEVIKNEEEQQTDIQETEMGPLSEESL